MSVAAGYDRGMKFRVPRVMYRLMAAILAAVSSLALVASPVLAMPPPAQAASGPDITALMWQGLWQGTNLSFGGITIPNPAPAHNSTAQAPGMAAVGGGKYAALGDSVAAGVGLATPLTVPPSQSVCGRTAESYPSLVSKALDMPLTDATCSGATAGDLITDQRGSPEQPPQLDTAFAAGRPSLMTITAGANDVHWEQFLYTCYYTDCATVSSSATAAALRGVLRAKLVSVFSSIQFRSNGQPPTVMYTGYYNPVSAACEGHTQAITAAELKWFNDQVTALNGALQSVIRLYPFVHFVPIDFSGHDICSPDPWVQGLTSPRPFHPTAAGQQAIAQAVLQSLGR